MNYFFLILTEYSYTLFESFGIMIYLVLRISDDGQGLKHNVVHTIYMKQVLQDF